MYDFFCCSVCAWEKDTCDSGWAKFCKVPEKYLEDPEEWEKGYEKYLAEEKEYERRKK